MKSDARTVDDLSRLEQIICELQYGTKVKFSTILYFCWFLREFFAKSMSVCLGGIDNDLRPQAWKYLFGFYPPLLSKM
jgi:hypothetical protein